jgi:deoxycytidine triphosphate deaminase
MLIAVSIKADHWIRARALEGMIEPFADRQVRAEGDAKIISYGLSSFGYDLRAAREWKIFVNAFHTVVDPKEFDPRGFVDFEGDECIIPPNSFVLARSVEYMRIPENVMVVAVGKSSYARCFSGNTRVALVDGTSPTLEDMAHRAQTGELFWGYSLNAYGRIVMSLLESPRFIGRDSLLEITLDNNETIEVTPDHIFITRDGREVAAGDLQANDSLMPLYRKPFRGYEMTYQPLQGYYYPTQRLADEWNIQNGLYAELEHSHRHHKDHKRRNNNPWNIERMNATQHIRLHNSRTYLSFDQGGEFDPILHGLAVRDAFERLRQDDVRYRAFKEQQRQKATDFWHDPKYIEARARLLAWHKAHYTPEEREIQRQRIRAAYANDPALRARIGDLSRAAWAKDDGSRRSGQREMARQINLRQDITEETVRQALDSTGSIRGAARFLNVDRSAFRRFPHVLQQFRGLPVVNHRVTSVKQLPGEHDVYCLSVPETGNFALEAGVFVHNCGVVANVTPLEPGWEGHVTLEFSNTTPLPARMYANEGCVQLLFFEGERPDVTYADRKGKYQGQTGVTLPRL